MSTLEKAIEIATEAHQGQLDKAGRDYIGHPLRVMEMGKTEEEKIVGVLHDVIEDTDWTFERLAEEGFSDEVISALKCVTKTSENENYDDFIDRVKKNPLAVAVKINDLTDNMDIRRLPYLSDKDVKRLKKYLKAYKRLTGDNTTQETRLMIKVACIGDSITSGFSLLNPRRDSYPSLLQKMLGDGYEVRNFGVLDTAARFDADTPYVRKKAYTKSLDWNPDIVLIMLGSNDTKRRNWDPEIFRRDYRKIVSSYMELPSCPRVCLIAPIQIFRVWGIPLMGLYPETMEEGVRPAIHEIAADLGLQCIDLKEVFNDSSYCVDGVHPQRKGTRMIAEYIFKERQRYDHTGIH